MSREFTTYDYAEKLGQGSILIDPEGQEYIVEDLFGRVAFGRGPLGLYGRLPPDLKPRLRAVG